MSQIQLQCLLALLAHFDQWAKPNQDTKLKLYDLMNEVEKSIAKAEKP